MMIGTLLQYGAAGTGIVGTGLMLYSISNEEYAEYGAYLTGIASLFSALALFYLANQFLVTDYTNGYVWTHVADYLSPLYRVTALYSGVEGSLLLWATLVGLVAYWTVRTGVSDRSERIVATITVAVAAVFYVHAAIRTPFTPLDLRTGGTMFGPTGLNPLLKSPYMAIHPPITFIGYSLTVVPFAIGITHFLRLLHDGEGTFHSWVGSATRWLRLSWGFLTASVALGAFWSYTTLGWGGLWAWDPVETAILVTWLFVTATLHVLSNYRARGEHPLLAPTMTVLSLPSAIFARFITQSGTSELHSFASGASPILTALLVVTTVVAVVLPLVRWLQLDGSESGADQRLLSHPFLLSLGSMVIGVLTFVSFWGLIFPQLQQYVGGPRIAVSATFYNMWSFPLVLVVLLLIGLYNDFDVRGREGLKLLAGVIVLSAAAALVPLPAWQINPAKTSGYYGVIGQLNILALAPPAAYAIGATVTRLGVRLPGIGSRERRLALSGVGLVHVGIVLIVLSAPFTYMFASSAAGMVPIAAGGHGGGVTLGESTITVSASNYNASYVHSDLSLSDRERGTLRQQLAAAAYSARKLPQSASGEVIVYGTISDLRRWNGTGIAQLDGTDVWVGIGPVRENTSVSGVTVYAQGTITSSNVSSTYVRTNGMFVGTRPIDAIVPDHRATHREITLTISRNDRSIARVRTSTDYHLAYGAVARPTIHRGLLSETYVAMRSVQYVSGMPVASVLVKRIPLMNVVRVGVALLLVGSFLLALADPEEDTPQS